MKKMKEFDKPYIRFFNADAYGRNMNYYINGKSAAENIPFGHFTGFMSVPEGMVNISVSCIGNKESAGIDISFDNTSVYTVAAVNIGDEISLFGIKENFHESSRSMGHIRVCNLSVDVREADVYANSFQILGDVDFLEISRYINIIPDTYEISIKDDETEKTVLNCGMQTFKSGKYNTLYIIGRINSNPSLQCVVSTDAMSYESSYL